MAESLRAEAFESSPSARTIPNRSEDVPPDRSLSILNNTRSSHRRSLGPPEPWEPQQGLGERLDRHIGQVDGTRRVPCLRFSPLKPPADFDDLLVDPNRPHLDVDVVALHSHELRPPKGGICTEQRKGTPRSGRLATAFSSHGLRTRTREQSVEGAGIRMAGFLPISSSSSARFRSIRSSLSASCACRDERFDTISTRSQTSFVVIPTTARPASDGAAYRSQKGCGH